MKLQIFSYKKFNIFFTIATDCDGYGGGADVVVVCVGEGVGDCVGGLAGDVVADVVGVVDGERDVVALLRDGGVEGDGLGVPAGEGAQAEAEEAACGEEGREEGLGGGEARAAEPPRSPAGEEAAAAAGALWSAAARRWWWWWRRRRVMI